MPEDPAESVALPEDIASSPIEFFELRMKLDTTLTIGETHWAKPGCEGAIRWRRLPSEQELKDAATYIQFAVIDPVLQDVISHMSQRLEEQRKRRG